MKRILFSFYLISLLVISGKTQTASSHTDDSLAIRKAVLDYAEGYYSGDAARMERAIHFDLNKATPRDLPATGKTMLVYTTYSSLVENTRAKVGLLSDTARHIKVKVLNVDTDVANAQVMSANFCDYLQLVKFDNQWKIVNVLFTSGTKQAPRIKDFKADNEKAAIEQTALDYLAGISGSDAARIEKSISPEFSKVTIAPLAATGKSSLRRQRAASLIENTFARIGKQDEVYRNNRVSILDIYDGLAVVRCDLTGAYEFIQLYKDGNQWKILNSLSKPGNTLTLQQAMTVIVGDAMPDFTLPAVNGKPFTLSAYKGKNVLLVFPRGWIGAQWCPYCPYQYLELEQLEQTQSIRSKNNLEVAFVLPYSPDRIKDWIEKFPEAVQTIEGTKNPDPAPAPGTVFYDYSNWAKKMFPISFNVKKEDKHELIPVLADEKRELSRQLKIFTNFWDGISAEQNVATVLIIDKNGILRFKYISQMTEDRPSVQYLLDFIKKMK
jgi:peroxiredoxin